MTGRLQVGQKFTGDFEVTKVVSPYAIQVSNELLGEGSTLTFEKPHDLDVGDILQGEIQVESQVQ